MSIKDPTDEERKVAEKARKSDAVMEAWREEHPGAPDPDALTVWRWLAEGERADAIECWRETRPDEPLPDSYEETRMWYIHVRQQGVIAFCEAHDLPLPADAEMLKKRDN
jgi:hypothetical protein